MALPQHVEFLTISAGIHGLSAAFPLAERLRERGEDFAGRVPVFDHFCENVATVADSNHGWKMIGVGHLIADEILGERQELLKPFRFGRFERGELQPVSNSPYPWS